MLLHLVLAIALLSLFSAAAPAQTQTASPEARLRIGTRIIPPFVMRDDKGQLTGFSIEIWQAVARQLGVASDYVVVDSVGDILNDVASGRTDVGVAAISITSERKKSFDFSQPMADSGLAVAIPAGSGSALGPVRQFFAFFGSWNFLEILGGVILVMLIPAPFIWLAERNSGGQLITAKTKLGQFAQAAWWSICTLGTQSQSMPIRPIGRMIAIPWILFALLFSSFFTAAVTARMTVQQLEKTIAGPDDLDGRTVATVAGTTSEEWLKARRVRTMAASTIEAALQAVVDGRADAVVFDQPVLSYLIAHGMRSRIRIVGPTFENRHYGIVFKPNARERSAVDVALLAVRESGEYRKIEQKYFVAATD